MKRFFKIFLIVLLVLFSVLAIAPFFFQSQISETVKSEINKSIDAKADFKNYSLSLINSFPDFRFRLNEFCITGNPPFENDTLLSISQISLKLDVFSVISGNKMEIKSVIIDNPILFAIINSDSIANFDIVKSSDEEIDEELPDTSSSDYSLSLKEFKINNALIVYDDQIENMIMSANGLNFGFSGSLSEKETELNISTSIADLDLVYQSIAYLNSVATVFEAEIFAEIANSTYTLKQNSLKLNELTTSLVGSVKLLENDAYDLDIKFDASKTEFKHILSLIPAVYYRDFEDIKTFGEVELNSSVKGIYSDDKLPAFNLNLNIDKAFFKYPDLPKSAENIAVHLSLSNPGGDADNTIVDLKKFHADLGNNPVDASMSIKNPISDPNIRVSLQSVINFESLADVVPLEDFSLKGIIETDMNFHGLMSDLEKEEYQNFKAEGYFNLKSAEIISSDFPSPLQIEEAELNISPSKIVLQKFNFNSGNTDININGNIENYLTYLFIDDVLSGSINLVSDNIDYSDFSVEEDTETEVIADSSDLELFVVPENIDLRIFANSKRIKHDNIILSNLEGILAIENQRVDLSNLSFEMFDGKANMNGIYSCNNHKKANFNYDLSFKNANITKTVSAFNTIEQIAPVLKYCQGKFTTQMKISSEFDENFDIIAESLNGYGKFISKEMSLEKMETLDKLSKLLKTDKYKSLEINDIDANFTIRSGTFELEPTDISVNNTNASFGGTHSIANEIDYDLKIKLSESELSKINLPSGFENLGINSVDAIINIFGKTQDPKLKLDFSQSGENIKDVIKESIETKVNETIDKEKEKLRKEAREKADKIINEAKKQAEKIRSEGKKAAKKVVDEAEKKAKKLEDAAKTKSLIERKIAEKAAQKLRDEAKGKAKKIELESNKNADKIINTAQQEADKILNANI